MGSAAVKQYLDDNGNPIAAPAKQYLDDDGNPIGQDATPAPAPLSGPIGDKVPEPNMTREVNQGNLREGFKGLGKELAATAQTIHRLNTPAGGNAPTFSANPFEKVLSMDTDTHGNREQQAGKVVGAALEAMVPIGDVAEALPEAKTIASAIRKPFSLKAVQESLAGSRESIQKAFEGHLGEIQDAWHQGVRGLLDSTAKEAGVKVDPAISLHDAAGNVARALKAKATGLYRQLDEAIGGTRFQTFDEQISNVKRLLKNSAGIDPDKDGILIERINALEGARDKALQEAISKGVDPNLIHEANAAYRQGSALEDLGTQIQSSTSGLRADVANGIKAEAESLSPSKLSPRLHKMYNSGRLQQALGKDRADALLRAAEGTTQKAKDAAAAAARMADAAAAKAQTQADAVKTRRIIGGAAAASVGAPKAWEWFRHFIGE